VAPPDTASEAGLALIAGGQMGAGMLVGLHERTGIDIPETGHPRLLTLDSAIACCGSFCD